MMKSPPRRPPYIPSKEEFTAGMRAYEGNEPRGRDYFIALRQLTIGWGESSAMGDAIWVLLKSWHRECYRFGRLDLSELARCVETYLPILSGLRGRTIESLCTEDEQVIEKLYGRFTTATRRHNQRGFQESADAFCDRRVLARRLPERPRNTIVRNGGSGDDHGRYRHNPVTYRFFSRVIWFFSPEVIFLDDITVRPGF
jgi:hypothetical protein